jgi:hypothetical protein
MNMRVVIGMSLKKRIQTHNSDEELLRRYWMHTLVFSFGAVAFAAVTIFIVISASGGDGVIVALFTSAPMAAFCGFMAGVSYFSGVRDVRKDMMPASDGKPAGVEKPDDPSRGELRGDIALYVILSAMCVYSLYVFGSAAMRDLPTADYRYVASVATYTFVIGFFAALTVFVLAKDIKYLRKTFGYLRRSNE